MNKQKHYKKLPDEKPAAAKELVAAIHKSGLIGMWKDRTHICNSEEFAGELRKRASKRKLHNTTQPIK